MVANVRETFDRPLLSGQKGRRPGAAGGLQALTVRAMAIAAMAMARRRGRKPGPGLSREPRGYFLDSNPTKAANAMNSRLATFSAWIISARTLFDRSDRFHEPLQHPDVLAEEGLEFLAGGKPVRIPEFVEKLFPGGILGGFGDRLDQGFLDIVRQTLRGGNPLPGAFRGALDPQFSQGRGVRQLGRSFVAEHG